MGSQARDGVEAKALRLIDGVPEIVQQSRHRRQARRGGCKSLDAKKQYLQANSLGCRDDMFEVAQTAIRGMGCLGVGEESQAPFADRDAGFGGKCVFLRQSCLMSQVAEQALISGASVRKG